MRINPSPVPSGRPRTPASTIVVFAALFTITSLTACGGESATGPSEPGFQQTFNGNVVAYGSAQHSLTASRAGQLRLALSWTNSAIDLDLYLTDGNCNSYPPLNCTTLATAATATGTSETLNRQVVAGEQVRFWVDNFHRTLASDYTIQVTIQ